MDKIAFFDLEITFDNQISAIGATKYEIKGLDNLIKCTDIFNSPNIDEFYRFIGDCKYICGHNIFNHDLKYLDLSRVDAVLIDTLPVDPLLFPDEEHHDLIKDYKTQENSENDPVEDSEETKAKFVSQVKKFASLPEEVRSIYSSLLANYLKDTAYNAKEKIFYGFFAYNNSLAIKSKKEVINLIKSQLSPDICLNEQTDGVIYGYTEKRPAELAYAFSAMYEKVNTLSLWIKFNDDKGGNYPETVNVINSLKRSYCADKLCPYCGRLHKLIYESLSLEQQEILTKNDGDIVIAAGPGSGKTTALVNELAKIILFDRVDPEDVMLISFTRSAVSEFKKRAIALLNNFVENIDDIEITTFHTLCLKIIQSDNYGEDLRACEEAALEKLQADRQIIKQKIILLDEVQDLNNTEIEIMSVLSSGRRIIAVGDDDQAIYTWRQNSCADSISKIMDICKVASPVMLSNNYRSSLPIINFANSFREKLAKIQTKKLSCMSDSTGVCEIVCHCPAIYDDKKIQFDEAVIQDISDRKNSGALTGATAILTYENRDANRIWYELKEKNIEATLVKNKNEGYIKIYDLIEIQYFLNLLRRAAANKENSYIPEKIWTDAKRTLAEKFSEDVNIEECLAVIEQFEQANTKLRLRDFIYYLKDMNVNELQKRSEITVSTIHKTKGTEYDNVYILLYDNNSYEKYKEDKKQNSISQLNYLKAVYVAITRAKTFLQIHCTKDSAKIFKGIKDVKRKKDRKRYKNAEYIEEIYLQLTPKDINLGLYIPGVYSDDVYRQGRHENFAEFIDFVKNLKTNAKLELDGISVCDKTTGRTIAELSNIVGNERNKGLRKINDMIDEGYFVDHITLRYIMLWKDKNENSKMDEPTPIPLPEICFKKGKV
ncbi:MAG: ATP-dependent helicase [Clostridia bacterium]|nr:ATP-dependent helicase [Clostridia bacterium]